MVMVVPCHPTKKSLLYYLLDLIKDNSKWKINLPLLKNTYPEVIYLTGQYLREFQLSDLSSIWLFFSKKQQQKYILVIWLTEKHNGDDSSGKKLLNLYSLEYMRINLRLGRNSFETYMNIIFRENLNHRYSFHQNRNAVLQNQQFLPGHFLIRQHFHQQLELTLPAFFIQHS